MKPTTLHSLDAFWAPSERIFLAKAALGRRGGHGAAVAPSLHGHSREELKERSTRIAEAIEFFRTAMKEVRQDIARDDFKRIQILYYRIRNYVEALHAANLELTGDNGYRQRKLATLYETPEWRAFARISDRFRQGTPKYRRRKRAYDAERNACEDVRSARQTPEARARIAFNERRRYHGRKLHALAERLRRELDAGADAAGCERELRVACETFLARFEPERTEADRAAMCERWVQRALGDADRQRRAA
jgi:hypothetical protein